MLWPLIAAGAGAVGLNYQAAKDLDTSGSGQKRLGSFWPAFILGAVSGLWIGVSFSSSISASFTFIERWFGIVPQVKEEDTSSETDFKNVAENGLRSIKTL